jgi:hypothetical protein
MRSSILALSGALLAALAAFAGGSCSAAGNHFTATSDTTAGSGGHAGTGGSLAITVGSGTSGGGAGGCDGLHCSADLHDVLDCGGNVVTHCADTEGCGAGGVCVGDPCAAATANGSTIGCEFHSVVPGPEIISRGSCFAALLANTWTTPITIQVDYGGQPLDVSSLARTPTGSGASLTYAPLAGGQLAPGQVAVLFLSQRVPGGGLAFASCPAGITPGITTDPSITGTGLGKSFHITTSAPVVAYDMYPYGGAASYVASATLLIPTAAWGTNYVAADGFQEDPGVGDPPFIQIVAAGDDTHVTISPTAAIVGGTGVAGTAKGQPATYTLGKGQVLQLMEDAELAGSPITSDKPVSVWGGASCMNIPVGVYACDSAHQQLLAVKAMGHEYAAVRYRDRTPGANEAPPWTLVGAVDGTALTYDPAPPAGAPTTLLSGQMARFDAGSPFTVRSQDSMHPFYLAGHMTGHDAIGSFLGDAETVNVVAPEQFLARYLFITDPTYGNAHLVLVRPKAKDDTFKDVSLDCVGVLGGWQPLGSAGKYEYTRVDLVVNGVPQGTCDNGVHSADSVAPFGLTVWGWDNAVSYAYPAGMSTLPINTVVVPAIPK